jgi:taurine dioxygenase
MEFTRIKVTPLGAALGAEVSGLSLAETLDDETVAEVHQALATHLVLFLRDQDISLDDHKRFARCFGSPLVHPLVPGLEGHPEILVVEFDRAHPPGGIWHTDLTFLATPPSACVLRALDVPPLAGDTLWASMHAAYEALSDKMQRFLADLVAIHDFRGNLGRNLSAEEYARVDAALPAVAHPVVRTHPITGRKGLFVNRGFTTTIGGMRPSESMSVLNFLFQHIALPEFQIRFRWERHSIAIWDNRCTQHYAVGDYWPQHRLLHRVTIEGDRPR